LEVRTGETPLALGGAKQRALLALLVLDANRVVSRDRLIDELWGEAPPETAVTTVQVYVSRLRKLLPAGSLQTRAPGYLLAVEPKAVDRHRFEGLVTEARGAAPARASPLLREALALWRGSAFAEFGEVASLQGESGRLEELRLAAVEDRIEAELELGLQAELVGELETLVVEQPERMRLRGQLMLALYRCGRHGQALAAFQEARATLDELGLEPSETLRRLERQILNQDPALDLAVRPPANARAVLPVPRSSFVGRERELAELISFLRNGGRRLVTLTGPGGSGKTRLAIEAATEAAGKYPDGVFWIPLASLAEPRLVVETIARTLESKDSLADRIGDRTLLLLLDNFEHLIDAAVELSTLLSACRNLRLLVTSREVLRLQGEIEYPVPPLAQAEAEELFCVRSRLPRDEAIADLCRHLDDLPLAVELAAARTAVLSPEQIRDRLTERLDLFKGGRDADPRQQTLRATIEWSYELLTEPERQLFARLAVFAGGCTLDAAEDICNAELDVLQSLVDKSLVRKSDRFWMLETIGELARERLRASSEAGEMARRHADYFLALAEKAEPALKGPNQGVWLERLEDDHDNLRKSLDWLLESHEPERAARLAAALWMFWYMHGHYSEGRRWLRRALDATADEPSQTRSTVLDGAGYLAIEQGDTDEALALVQAGLASAKQAGATAAAAIAAAHLCAALSTDPSAALAAGEEARALARAAGDDWALAVALNNLGVATWLLGEDPTPYHEEALALRRRIGDGSRIALSLGNLAVLALQLDDLEKAASLYSEAFEIATAIGDKRHICMAGSGLAEVAYREHRWQDADTQARDILRTARELGAKHPMTSTLAILAGIAAITGDPTRAARLASAVELHAPIGLDGVQADLEHAKAGCDPRAWEQAWAAGQAMSLDQAADYALSSAETTAS
jgi:predicted ATPase/DNA-binding SARP family transcriptional activator